MDKDFFLIQRMKKGDEEAMELFVRKYYPMEELPEPEDRPLDRVERQMDLDLALCRLPDEMREFFPVSSS